MSFWAENLDEKLNEIRDEFESLQERNKRLSEQVVELKSEHYQSDELTRMKQELETAKAELRNGFSISAEERMNIEAWKIEHIEKVHKGNEYAGAIGGRFAYKFIPTSIGTIGTVICECGEEHTFCEL